MAILSLTLCRISPHPPGKGNMYRFSLDSTVAAGHVGCPAVLLHGARGYGWSACVDGYLLSLLPSIATECLVTDRPIAAQLVFTK